MSLFDVKGKRITKITSPSAEHIPDIATHLPAAIEELVRFKTLLVGLFEKSFDHIDTRDLPEIMRKDIASLPKPLKTPDVPASLMAWSKMEERTRIESAVQAYKEYYSTIRALANFEFENYRHSYCQCHPLVLTAVSGLTHEGPRYMRTAAALIESGADFAQKSALMGIGVTALEMAIMLEEHEILKLMVENKPKNRTPYKPDDFDIALKEAVKSRDAAVIAILSPAAHTMQPLRLATPPAAPAPAPAAETVAEASAQQPQSLKRKSDVLMVKPPPQ